MKKKKSKLKKIKKVQYKKKKKIMDFTISIPEEHVASFIDLLCIGANYKEYIDDPENVGEMILNPVTKLQAAKLQHEKIVLQYAKGQNHRRKENIINQALLEAKQTETDLDVFLENKKL